MNTSIYLARLGNAPYFLTALGKDPYSTSLIREWEQECIQIGYILRHPTRLPGLYAIQTDHVGERSFYYWRSNSAARKFLDLDGANKALDFACDANWLYLSGITLSIFNDAGRAKLCEVARRVKAKGGEVVFDPNYRARGWQSKEDARDTIARFAHHVTLALPTIEDENAVFGQNGASEHALRWKKWGVPQTIMKCGASGAILFGSTGGEAGEEVPAEKCASPVDTTGAGDSFNAAVINSRIRGESFIEAAMAGNRLAAEVIKYSGAILSREKMPDNAVKMNFVQR